ncbi:MAG: hypothetical protein ACI8PZ_000635 [Myxococcota bacterium]|jgi:hypothetical protein
MAQPDTRTTKQLFREWRSGDRDAGAVMAQRFADWYYAIAVARLGESRGNIPCQAACQRFAEGVVGVKESRSLVPWAHRIIQEELEKAGVRAADGDEPNAYTNHQSPKSLLLRARDALPQQIELLQLTYTGGDPERIETLAAPLGGNPLGVLLARYRVKQWLRDQAQVPFEVAPDDPVLDRAPLPLYESAQMNSPAEEESFEHWMISDIDLCRDIAEFAHFAIALRGGLPADAPSRAPQEQSTDAGSAPERPVESPTPQPSVVPESSGSGAAGGIAVGLVVAGIGGLALFLLLGLGAAYMLM